MKKQQASFPLWAVGLILAVVVGGYLLFQSQAQVNRVAEIGVTPVNNSLESSAGNAKTQNSISPDLSLMKMDASQIQAYVPRPGANGIKANYDVNLDLYKASIPKDTAFSLTRSNLNLTIDKSKLNKLKLKLGLTDGMGLLDSSLPPVTTGTLTWTATLRDASRKVVAIGSLTTPVLSNTINPQQVSEIIFAPTTTKSTTQKVTELTLTLVKPSASVELNISGLEMSSSSSTSYIGPAESSMR